MHGKGSRASLILPSGHGILVASSTRSRLLADSRDPYIHTRYGLQKKSTLYQKTWLARIIDQQSHWLSEKQEDEKLPKRLAKARSTSLVHLEEKCPGFLRLC